MAEKKSPSDIPVQVELLMSPWMSFLNYSLLVQVTLSSFQVYLHLNNVSNDAIQLSLPSGDLLS